MSPALNARIYGIGTDVCDIRRIRASLERHGDRFLFYLVILETFNATRRCWINLKQICYTSMSWMVFLFQIFHSVSRF